MSGTRSTSSGVAPTAANFSAASAIESGSVRKPKCLPMISSTGQPKSASAVSAANVKLPSGSARQMTSGVAWMSPRKRASSRVSRSSRFELVRAMAAWSARPPSRSSSSASNMRGSALDTASVPMTSPPGARSGVAAMPRSASRSATMMSEGSCGMRGSVR